MKLKHISTFFLIGSILTGTFLSCNGSDSESISSTASADAQIYSFSAKSIARNSQDTAHFAILGKSKFIIDQANHLIYNVDSLPYLFDTKKIAATINFSSSSPSSTQVVYPGDSIVDWSSSTDSIDFMLYPKKDNTLEFPQVRFKVTAANGNTSITYTIKLLIHKVDPDSIIWKREADLPQAGQNRSLLVDGNIYAFVDNGGTITLSKSSSQSISWSTYSVAGLPSIAFSTINYYKGSFYATDGAFVYKSADGTTWSGVGAKPGKIVGVVPKAETGRDSVFVMVRQGGANIYVELESDFSTTIDSKEENDFPVDGYSVVFDEKNSTLLVTGGRNKDGQWSNSTWYIEYRSGKLQVIEVNKLVPFDGAEGLVSFFYNDRLYAWAKEPENDFKLYSSDRGMNWVSVPAKQYFDATADKVTGQAILVDDNNYIWTFGGAINSSTNSKQIWRGRLNSLNK
mgnify:CR=1 FL=1